MKTFVLTVSRYFPTDHRLKAGQPTFFIEKIEEKEKIHTIRANYALWKNRIDQVNDGKAVLSLRYWSGKPYNSKQEEFMRLGKWQVGVEKLNDPTNFVFAPIENKVVDWNKVAKNDGLEFLDFCEWFKVRNPEPMAIIHFTDFRYGFEEVQHLQV